MAYRNVLSTPTFVVQDADSADQQTALIDTQSTTEARRGVETPQRRLEMKQRRREERQMLKRSVEATQLCGAEETADIIQLKRAHGNKSRG